MINENFDIHKATAALITNTPYDQIEDRGELRNSAKLFNFGTVYTPEFNYELYAQGLKDQLTQYNLWTKTEENAIS